MTLHLSAVADAHLAGHGGNFSARRLDLGTLEGFVSPVMGFDHFRMKGRTFAPHPHAGFSAVTYVFEDSKGSLRNRDSLGNDIVADPGDMIWTQAGSGVVHDELPAEDGAEVHGLQLFVNMSRRNKGLAPMMHHAAAGEIPDRVIDGNHIRVVVGELDGTAGRISPAEDFRFFDARLTSPLEQHLPQGWNGLVYVLSGQVRVDTASDGRVASAHQAIGVASAGDSGGTFRVTPVASAQVLLLAGRDPKEPVAAWGPFIMTSDAEIEDAFARYRSGKMGRLAA